MLIASCQMGWCVFKPSTLLNHLRNSSSHKTTSKGWCWKQKGKSSDIYTQGNSTPFLTASGSGKLQDYGENVSGWQSLSNSCYTNLWPDTKLFIMKDTRTLHKLTQPMCSRSATHQSTKPYKILKAKQELCPLVKGTHQKVSTKRRPHGGSVTETCYLHTELCSFLHRY